MCVRRENLKETKLICFKTCIGNWHPNDGMQSFAPLLEKIKKKGKDQSHDCLIGISGGVDSCYLVHLAKAKLGLNPLVFHVDTGWNSQISVNNIAGIIDKPELVGTEIMGYPVIGDDSDLDSLSKKYRYALTLLTLIYMLKCKFKSLMH